MSKRTSVMRRATATIAATALITTGAVATAPAATAAEPDRTLTLNPAYASGPFKGWGTSLVWMANATGEYPAELRDELIDMVFGDDGLNLNIARYNIGGGNATDVPPYLRPGGAVPGWWNPDAPLSDAQGPITSNYADRDRIRAAWTGENASDYDFTADSAQLAWVDAIKDDVDTWEAFSNSPPYFMTESGFVSGGFDANWDQIRTDSLSTFATYIKTVVEHVEDTHGISFNTINPLNEPNTNYWGTQLGGNGWPTGGRQEGAHAGPWLQSEVIKALDAELAEPDTTTQAKIAAPDETHPTRFMQDWYGWDETTQGIVDQLNVHTYATGDRNRARDIAKASGKPLWMSEVEGNWGGDWWNPNSIENGLGIASLVTNDLRELESEAWVLWQPVEDLYNMEKVEKKNWGSVFIDFDCNEDGNSLRRLADGDADPSCGIQINSKYNTLRNFTHYIEPGDQLIAVNDNDTTAAVDADGSGATLVYTNNGDSARTIEIDLSQFGEIGAGASVTPIVTTESPANDRTANALVQGSSVPVDAATKSATLTVPAKSVTTFVVSDVAGVSESAPAMRDGESYTITGVQSGKPLAAGSSAAVLGTVGSATPEAQTWEATLLVDEPGTSRDRFALRLADGRTLASDGGNTTFKTLTDEQAIADNTTHWLLNSTDGQTFNLLNAEREDVLDVSGQSTSTGAGVGLYGSNWGANQSWTLQAQSEWTIDVLEALLATTDADPNLYTEASYQALEDARAVAQTLVGEGSTDAAAIEAAYNTLTEAFDGLVEKIEPYTSFRPGQEWLDTAGNVIQAHGGQVVTSTDDDGETIYYLYGEDRTNGWLGTPGVHVYSSYDLYNWTDRGLALRAMATPDQFETDPYFEELYGDYTAEQKEIVFRDLGTTQLDPNVNPAIIERPKVIYNESTGKWVMWAHMDGPSTWSNALYAKAIAGVAVSDSPFGPFRYITGKRLHHASPDDPTNQAPENLGMARDMNLFVDDDGTGYIIYSSEENRTMFISKLNDEYTDLSAAPEDAVEGVDYTRIFVDWGRESPAIFKHDERYFLITSALSGWDPNRAEYGTATDILGDWTGMGDPFPWWAGANSWNSQPSSVIPLDRENGKYIYMGDRWNGGTDLKNAQMVWLPLNMGEGGDTLSVEIWDEWTLDELDQWAVWDVTGVPSAIALGDQFDVPTVTVTQNGETRTETVEWEVDGSFDIPGVVNLTGTLPGFGERTFTRAVAVVPEGVQYAVNAGGFRTTDWSALVAAAEQDAPLLNSLPDQPYQADAGTAKTWGYVSPGSGSHGDAGGDLFSTLRYAADGNDLTYRFGGLEVGAYTVYAGYADPWDQWDDRGARVTINGAVVDDEHVYGPNNDTLAYGDVAVGDDGEIAFTLSSTRGPDVQVSWLLVVLDEPAAPALDVSVVAGTRCIAKKVVVTAKVTNTNAVPVAVSLASAYGTKSFASVAPGKSATHAFTTRLANVEAGTVTVNVEATVNGAPTTVSVNAPYAAATCN